MAQLDHVPLSVQDSAVIAVEVLEAREEVEARSNSQAKQNQTKLQVFGTGRFKS